MNQKGKLKAQNDHENPPFDYLIELNPNSNCQVSPTPTQKNKDRRPRKVVIADRHSKRPSIQRLITAEQDIFGEQTQNHLVTNQLAHIRAGGQKKQSRQSESVRATHSVSQLSDAQPPSHFDQTGVLKEIIKRHKINSIVKNFIRKIKRVSVLKEPVEFQINEQCDKSKVWQKKGLQLPLLAEHIFSLMGIVQILVFSFIFSVELVFRELSGNKYMDLIEVITLILVLLEIVINLTTVKHQSGKKLIILYDIWHNYIYSGSLVIDLMVALILVLDLGINMPDLVYLKGIIFLKIPHCLDKIEQLQVYFINNLYNQQYWSLVKILLFNFLFAHIISIILTAMASINPGNNWMTAKGIEAAPWIQKYSWAYYWANTIMLTVGFGDIVASNYQEAICLVFIQTFSCMAFAYNINCVGSIIQQIRAKDAERSQKSKIFTKLTDKNKLSEELSWKINNYIQETARLRKIFDYQQERDFITNLPIEMKKDYLKQSNKKIFEQIYFFKSFISKTLYNLAEKIQMRVTHPQEVIQHMNDDHNLMILKSGSLGFVSKRVNSETQSFVMDILKLKEGDQPSLVNLDFISRKRSHYQIKSMQYSVFYFMSYEKFVEVLRETQMDFQFFCALRDRMKSIPDEFEVFSCQMCQGKHLKSLCPKLHYIPYIQNIIHKYLHNQKKDFNFRGGFKRLLKLNKSHNAFNIYKKSIDNVQRLSNLLQTKRRNRSEASLNDISDNDLSSCRTFSSWNSVDRSIRFLNQEFKNQTRQLFKEEITKIIKSEALDDEVWDLKSDCLHNFNGYFPDHNPNRINTHYYPHQLLKSDKNLNPQTSVFIQMLRSHSIRKSTLKRSLSKRSRKNTKKD